MWDPGIVQVVVHFIVTIICSMSGDKTWRWQRNCSKLTESTWEKHFYIVIVNFELCSHSFFIALIPN